MSITEVRYRRACKKQHGDSLQAIEEAKNLRSLHSKDMRTGRSAHHGLSTNRTHPCALFSPKNFRLSKALRKTILYPDGYRGSKR